MGTKSKKKSEVEKWVSFDGRVADGLPSLASWWSDEESFREVRVKLQMDGTVLAIAKGYSGDGGLVVCFGAGYGVTGALMGLDRSIQGGNWKEDKPWGGAK